MRIYIDADAVRIQWESAQEEKSVREKLNELGFVHEPTYIMWRMGIQIEGKAVKV